MLWEQCRCTQSTPNKTIDRHQISSSQLFFQEQPKPILLEQDQGVKNATVIKAWSIDKPQVVTWQMIRRKQQALHTRTDSIHFTPSLRASKSRISRVPRKQVSKERQRQVTSITQSTMLQASMSVQTKRILRRVKVNISNILQ